MKPKILTSRDKLFWICIGLGGVLILYFLYSYFNNGDDYAYFTRINYRNRFEIYVPEYLINKDSSGSAAALQFSDITNEVFLMIVEEKKADLAKTGITPYLHEYYEYIKSNITETILKPVIEEKENKINGTPALTCELSGYYADHQVFYMFTVLESSQAFYQVIGWTTDAIKHEVRKDLHNSILSFNLI